VREVLDTRFFVELFSSADSGVLERCRAKMGSLRRSGQGLLPTPVIAEVVHQACETLGAAAAERHRQALLHSGLRVLPLDAEAAAAAGLLKCGHRRTPFADCLVGAMALRAGARITTDDPHFAEFEGLKVTWI